MNTLTPYKFLSYLLLPIGVLLGLGTLMALVLAMNNMAMLFSVFISGGTVVYIFASFIFMQFGILKNEPCKPGLKDWIKVNGYVAMFFAVLGLLQGGIILTNPEAQEKMMAAVIEMQKGNLPDESAGLMKKIFKAVLYFLVVFSGLMVFHIFTSFRLLRQHVHLFQKKLP